MMYNVKLTKEATDNIVALPVKKKRQIRDAIQRIAEDPSVGKSLTNRLSGLCSYRSGNYRIIYKILHQQILIIVLAIGHRKDIYKKVTKKVL